MAEKKQEILVTAGAPQDITLDTPGGYIVKLVEAGAEARVRVRAQLEGEQRFTQEIIIWHAAPNTRAEVECKLVLAGRAQANLLGRIRVQKGCDGVQSFLTQRALLLSDGAQVEAVPELEIESNEVKCSHAASVASIDEEQLFYLMSRGLSRTVAEDLLMQSFLE